jgi:hypothetical protein
MNIEREEIETKGMDKLFNKTIVENFPNLEEGRDFLVQESFRTPN